LRKREKVNQPSIDRKKERVSTLGKTTYNLPREKDRSSVSRRGGIVNLPDVKTHRNKKRKKEGIWPLGRKRKSDLFIMEGGKRHLLKGEKRGIRSLKKDLTSKREKFAYKEKEKRRD